MKRQCGFSTVWADCRKSPYSSHGQNTLAAKIGFMSAEGGPTWDPKYILGVDFLDHDFLEIHIMIYIMRGQTLL